MHILTNDKVQYCTVKIQKKDNIVYLPGIAYKNKFFTKDKFFPLEAKKAATNYAKDEFLLAKGKVIYLAIKDNIGFTIWSENDAAKIVSAANLSIDIVTSLNLEQVVAKMHDIGGLNIKDRRYNLKTYPKCFVGNEAVAWMETNLDLSTEEAIRLGRRLISENWIHHVVNKQEFENEFLFYRFYLDEA